MSQIAETVAVATARRHPPPALVIYRLRIWQPVGTGASLCFEQSGALALLRAQMPFALACELMLAGHGALECARLGTRYRIRYLVESLDSGERVQLGHSLRGTLTPEEPIHFTRLRLVSLARGSYRLSAIAHAKAARAQPALFDLGLLEMV